MEKLQNWELRDMGYVTECHYWLGGFAGQRDGGPGRYPKIYIRGAYRMAHRWIYESERGPIPDGMHLHHLCRVTQCVNPAHLTPMSAVEHNSMKRKQCHGVQSTNTPDCKDVSQSGKIGRSAR